MQLKTPSKARGKRAHLPVQQGSIFLFFSQDVSWASMPDDILPLAKFYILVS